MTLLNLVAASASLLTVGNVPMLEISHVAQIDNLDHGDVLGKNRADFFAVVTINGKMHKSEVLAKDAGYPNWTFPLDLTKRTNKIVLSLWDDDGGLEDSDDHADISPRRHKKDLTFMYDRYTGRIWGDVKGEFGKLIASAGAGDDDKATIEFRIRK